MYVAVLPLAPTILSAVGLTDYADGKNRYEDQREKCAEIAFHISSELWERIKCVVDDH
jgi:hypothetical protein